MGIRFSFVAYVPRPRVDDVLAQIVRLCETGSQLERSLPWRPRRTLTFPSPIDGRSVTVGLDMAGLEEPIEDCLTLVFPVDAAVRYYDETDNPGTVGCIYLDVTAGDEWAEISLTAATTGMSEMFDASQGIQDHVFGAFRAGGAHLMLLDREEERDDERFRSEADWRAIDIDRYVAYLLQR